MIRAYELTADRLKPAAPEGEGIIWWDLVNPDRDEETGLQKRLGLELPTRDEMQEIEISSRLYSEDGGHFMTALIPSHTDADDAVIQPITFILIDHRLVTIRYTEPRAFTTFPQRAEKTGLGLTSGETILLGLLEAVVDRLRHRPRSRRYRHGAASGPCGTRIRIRSKKTDRHPRSFED